MLVASVYKTTKSILNQRQKWFPILTTLLAIGFVLGGGVVTLVELLQPLAIHRWHESELAALTVIVLGGTLMSLLWRPLEKPLLAQFFVIALIITSISIAPFKIEALGALALAAMFFIAYPNTRAFLRVPRITAMSKPLLLISLVMAVYFTPIIWQEFRWQAIGMATNDAHALLFHWVGSAVLLMLLVVGGLLAATKLPGWKELGLIIGGAFCYQGLMAMILTSQTGSWKGGGGLIAISIGIWYILFTLLEKNNVEVSVAPKQRKPRKLEAETSVARTVSQKLEVLPKRSTRELVHAH